MSSENGYLFDQQPPIMNSFSAWRHDGLLPLTTIKTYVDLLLQGHLGELTPKQEDAIQQILLASQRAMDHWQQPTEYFRYYYSHDETILEPVSPIVAIEDALSILRERQITNVDINLPNHLPFVKADYRLVTVIINSFTDWYNKTIYHNGFQHSLQVEYDTKDSVRFQIHTRQLPAEPDRLVRAPGLGIALAQLFIQAYGGDFEVSHTRYSEGVVDFTVPAWVEAP